MSEMTPCNACALSSVRARAARRGATVGVQRMRPPDEMGGWYRVQESDKSEPCAWFMELTVECCC